MRLRENVTCALDVDGLERNLWWAFADDARYVQYRIDAVAGATQCIDIRDVRRVRRYTFRPFLRCLSGAARQQPDLMSVAHKRQHCCIANNTTATRNKHLHCTAPAASRSALVRFYEPFA